MYRSVRYKFGIWLGIVLVGWGAVAGGVLLGRFYLGIIKQSSVPQGTKVNTDISRSVVIPSEKRVLLLNTIPAYCLQVGVFSDLQGAEEAARPLRDLGYSPYITQTAPFRLWLGIYQKRADTEFMKQQLKDKGFGSFTVSKVLNGSNLRYNKGAETFIQGISPLLEQYTDWFKENLALFDTGSLENLKWDQVNRQAAVIETVYNDLSKSTQDLTTNDPEINQFLTVLLNTAEFCQAQLQKFSQQKDQQSFAGLQNGLLKFIDNYVLLWEKLDNISKT